MKKKLIFIMFVLLVLGIKVNALNYRGCEASTISRLKSLITNINISYDYQMVDDYPSFSVTINNIPPSVYFIDTKDIYYGTNEKTYNFSDAKNGEITIYNYSNEGGSYKFYSSLSNCEEIYLGSKYYNFPTYNIYYGDPLCEDIPN